MNKKVMHVQITTWHKTYQKLSIDFETFHHDYLKLMKQCVWHIAFLEVLFLFY